MKKNILLVLGIAGMMIGCSEKSHSPEVKVQTTTESTPSFVIDSPPNFIYLKNQGFSVSKDSPYDIVYLDGNYYINSSDRWYRSTDYHGPWTLVQDGGLPSKISRYSWSDIVRYRDSDSSKHDKGNNQYQREDEPERCKQSASETAVVKRCIPRSQLSPPPQCVHEAPSANERPSVPSPRCRSLRGSQASAGRGWRPATASGSCATGPRG